MTISPTVYDWPSVVPVGQLFHAGGQAIAGGFTSGGVRIVHPEPGGVSWLEMTFGYQQNGRSALISWLMSKIANGNVFRVPLYRTPQLVPIAALGAAAIDAYEEAGVPWDNDQPFDNDLGWLYEPVVIASAASPAGATTLTVDMGAFDPGIGHGHVIGHRDVAYLVDDISYAGTVATIRVEPPLRKAVAVDDMVTLRPSGTFTAMDPAAFRGLYEPADLIRLGSVQFAEARL